MPQNNGRKPTRFKFSKEWCKKAATLEEGVTMGSPLAVNPDYLKPEKQTPPINTQPVDQPKSMADWLKSKKRRRK